MKKKFFGFIKLSILPTGRICTAPPSTRTPGSSEIFGHSGPTYEKSLNIFIRILLTKTKCFTLSSAPCSLDILPLCLLLAEASLQSYCKVFSFSKKFFYMFCQPSLAMLPSSSKNAPATDRKIAKSIFLSKQKPCFRFYFI